MSQSTTDADLVIDVEAIKESNVLEQCMSWACKRAVRIPCVSIVQGARKIVAQRPWKRIEVLLVAADTPPLVIVHIKESPDAAHQHHGNLPLVKKAMQLSQCFLSRLFVWVAVRNDVRDLKGEAGSNKKPRDAENGKRR